ncbi:glycosyltransferase, CAZy GT29 [Datura stramonium]|uniref:Glycosyltransferase, CAZy GT29 n=1 Tax=Datura stramonium TaxID=4076 RepID=A0ABS8SQP6_DATST|nr:glycosyltransferase, CAZy GT29 [Datura stramonium]
MTRAARLSRKPALVRLLCVAALFSIIIVSIQSSFFTGSWTPVNISQTNSDLVPLPKELIALGIMSSSRFLNHWSTSTTSAAVLCEQYRNMTTVLTREYLDSRPDGWFDYAAKRIAQLGADKCYNQTLCEEHLNLILPAKPPFHPRQFRRCAVVGNSGDLLKAPSLGRN